MSFFLPFGRDFLYRWMAVIAHQFHVSSPHRHPKTSGVAMVEWFDIILLSIKNSSLAKNRQLWLEAYFLGFRCTWQISTYYICIRKVHKNLQPLLSEFTFILKVVGLIKIKERTFLHYLMFNFMNLHNIKMLKIPWKIPTYLYVVRMFIWNGYRPEVFLSSNYTSYFWKFVSRYIWVCHFICKLKKSKQLKH